MANITSITSIPRLRMACTGVLVAIASLGALPAHADWGVKDASANRVLGDQVKGTTINKNLYNINQQLKILGNDSKPGDRIKDPDSAMPDPESEAATLNDGKQCEAVAKEQQTNCQTIVKIQNAQYKFMLTVYKTSNDRNEVLKTLLQERNNLKSDDYGKIADNTNKLTALYNLIALDRQQMESVNYAYEANLAYLRAKQSQIANNAQTGNGGGKGSGITLPVVGEVDLGSVISGLTTGLVLQGALELNATDKPDGMRTLTIGKDKGWW